jgi:hypothetical protein
METMTMTVQRLVDLLNTELKKYDFTKIRSHNEFHDLMGRIVSPFLPEVLKLSSWRIYHPDYPYPEYPLITYNRDFERLGNVGSYTDKGKFSNVRFEVSEEFKDIGIADCAQKIKALDKERRIKQARSHIAHIEGELAQAKKELDSLINTLTPARE